MNRFFALLLLVLPLALSSGCGLLLGNIKPVDEKSDQYGVVDLSKENPKVWTRLTAAQEGADLRDPDTTSTEIPDVAFQSLQTAAVISVNSSCRPSADAESSTSDLRTLANQLTYGISAPSEREEKPLTVQATPALQTTVQGTMNGNPIRLRTIVFKRQSCVYDLLYMAPPEHFAKNEADFDLFVASLRLK